MLYLIGTATIPSGTRTNRLNEDALGVLTESVFMNDSTSIRSACFLADGMGALDAPHLASTLAIGEAMQRFQLCEEAGLKCCVDSIVAANEALLGAKPKRDLGSTLTVLSLTADRFAVAHVGDNRLFHISAGGITCLTRDHSRLASQSGQKNPSLQEAKENKKSKKLDISLGERHLAPSDIHQTEGTLQDNDVLILCSDGLWTEIPELEILREVHRGTDVFELAEVLSKRAFLEDASDDISIIVVRSRASIF